MLKKAKDFKTGDLIIAYLDYFEYLHAMYPNGNNAKIALILNLEQFDYKESEHLNVKLLYDNKIELISFVLKEDEYQVISE